MSRTILVGSGNRKKLREITEILADLPVQILVPDDLPDAPPTPDETGATFEENAREKALAYAQATGLWTLADDSGLEVDALNGRPGVHSARYSGPNAQDASNNALLLKELAGVPPENRGAAYRCVLALAAPDQILLSSAGRCAGQILTHPRGTGGFGYDPLFFIPALNRTFAELSADEKAKISHRGSALRDLRQGLIALLAKAEHP